jgi:hypothetical protein
MRTPEIVQAKRGESQLGRHDLEPVGDVLGAPQVCK